MKPDGLERDGNKDDWPRVERKAAPFSASKVFSGCCVSPRGKGYYGRCC